MRFCSGTAFLVKFVLGLFELVQASSISDNEDIVQRARDSSDLGAPPDYEAPGETRLANFTPNLQSSSSPSITSSLRGSTALSSTVAPYYLEYLALRNRGVALGELQVGKGDVSIYPSVDSETALGYSNTRMALYAATETDLAESKSSTADHAFDVENVSNAAFIFYSEEKGEVPTSSTGSLGEFSEDSSIGTNSSLNLTSYLPLKAAVGDPSDCENAAITAAVVDNGMKKSSSMGSISRMTYREALTTQSLGVIDDREIRTARDTFTRPPLSPAGKKSAATDSPAKTKVKSSEQQKQQQPQHQQMTATTLGSSCSLTRGASSHSRCAATSLAHRRQMVTPEEVVKALAPAVTVDKRKSNEPALSNLSLQLVKAPAAATTSTATSPEPIKAIDGNKKSALKREHERNGPEQRSELKSKPLKLKPPNPPQQEQRQRSSGPSELRSFFQWGNLFRMPRHAAPPPAMNPNRFEFPRNEHTSKRFLTLLKRFRKNLKHHNGHRIKTVLFEDFEPILNYVKGRARDDVDKSDPKLSRKYSLTDSQPIKVFNSPPVRTWIPVRCDALGFDFRTHIPEPEETSGFGHAGKAGGKVQISFVYDANREARVRERDPGNPAPERVLYISKEYYDLEYFLNEYNFFQFAHLPYIPKPFCVEYGQYPKIIMEHIPGERVHYSFYRFGQVLRKNYEHDKETREEKMKTALIKVLAKILVTIKYIHSIGFIHADIKPENIMYDTISGRVVMIDFDLSVSAPYIFTGRGTESTIAPELNGLLQGPVHFGIDWWSYGSTAAMIISAGFAGILFDSVSEEASITKYFNYVPFRYIKGQNAYEMTSIPEFFPPAMRSFLYPFFNPDPSLRVFSEHNAYNWIRSHPIFSIIADWSRYEHLDLGPYSIATPMQIGFIAFSLKPVLLVPFSRFHKIFNNISSLFGNVFTTTKDGSLGNVEDSDDDSEVDSDEDSTRDGDDSDEEDDGDDSDEDDAQLNGMFHFEEDSINPPTTTTTTTKTKTKTF